jgi:cell division protein FtsW
MWVHRADKLFLWTTALLALVGFFIFFSASLGLLSREGPRFNFIVGKQFILLATGLGVMLLFSRIPHRLFQKLSLPLFLFTLVLTLLVFVPGLGFESGGARRWIGLGSFSFQPSEFLKLPFIFYLAALLSRKNYNVRSFRGGPVPFLLLITMVGVTLAAQPDIDTLVILFIAGAAMLFVSGARWSHLALVGLLLILGLGALIYSKPYILARLRTFINPAQDVLNSSYQINQSLIAIGSGGFAGRGFGRSIQKFKYLPEPIGDSIFAVASEEFGFLGSTLLVILFLLFALFGLRTAARAPTSFGRLATVGIVIMIIATAFSHIASLLGLIPLSGTPLVFVSHGGTALLAALAASGIILNVSRQTTR